MSEQQVFIIQPFDKAFEAVYQLIASASAKAGVVAYRADSVPSSGKTVTEKIHQAIKDAAFIIADVSDSNANVMYEVGFAQAQNRPILLIANHSRSIPFDLAGLRMFIYDLDQPLETINSLAETIKDIQSNPKGYLFSEISAKRKSKNNVFISYSHRDKEYLDRLMIHLRPLEKEGLIDLWVDTRIRPGDIWKKEIESALEQSTVAVLLVSADFLASDFITENELPPLLRNAEQAGTRILPLILKPCRFTRDKNLRHFQAINDPSETLIQITEADQEYLYDSVAREIESTLQRG